MYASIYIRVRRRKYSSPALVDRVMVTLGKWVDSIWKGLTGQYCFRDSDNDLILDLCASWLHGKVHLKNI